MVNNANYWTVIINNCHCLLLFIRFNLDLDCEKMRSNEFDYRYKTTSSLCQHLRRRQMKELINSALRILTIVLMPDGQMMNCYQQYKVLRFINILIEIFYQYCLLVMCVSLICVQNSSLMHAWTRTYTHTHTLVHSKSNIQFTVETSGKNTTKLYNFLHMLQAIFTYTYHFHLGT